MKSSFGERAYITADDTGEELSCWYCYGSGVLRSRKHGIANVTYKICKEALDRRGTNRLSSLFLYLWSLSTRTVLRTTVQSTRVHFYEISFNRFSSLAIH